MSEKSNKLILVIDDIEIVASQIKENLTTFFEKRNIDNYEIQTIVPNIKIGEDYLESKEKLCSSINNKLNLFDECILVADRSYFPIDSKKDETYYYYHKHYLKIDDILKKNERGAYPLKHNKDKINNIFIYSYDKWYPRKFYNNIKTLLALNNEYDIASTVKGRTNFVVLEMSMIYSLYPFISFYEVSKEDFDKFEDSNENYLEIKIGSTQNLRKYGAFASTVVEEFIKGDISGSPGTLSHYLHLNSLRYNKFMAMVNEEYFKKDSRYELATVSVIADDIKMYLLDVPYRYYYSPMNDYIRNKGLDNYFKKGNDEKTEQDYKQGLNYTYFNYEVNSTDPKIFLNSIFKFENEDEHPSIVFDNNNNNWITTEEKNNLLEWLSILDASIFYNDDGIETENNGTTEERKWSDNFTERIVHDQGRQPNKSNYVIEIFWFYHDIQMEEYGLHSAINYSFFRVINQSSANNDSIKNIHDIATRFYDYRRPIIVAKAKEVLFPYYHSEMMTYALQSAVSQITARNYAHHIGSHVKNRTTLPEINKRIGKLYPEIDI